MRPLFPKGSITLLICAALILGSSLGCKRLSDLAKKKGSGDEPPTASSTPRDTDAVGNDASLVKKSNLYITECFNKYSNSIVSSYNRYQSWVRDIDAGPTGKNRSFTDFTTSQATAAIAKKRLQTRKQWTPNFRSLRKSPINMSLR